MCEEVLARHRRKYIEGSIVIESHGVAIVRNVTGPLKPTPELQRWASDRAQASTRSAAAAAPAVRRRLPSSLLRADPRACSSSRATAVSGRAWAGASCGSPMRLRSASTPATGPWLPTRVGRSDRCWPETPRRLSEPGALGGLRCRGSLACGRRQGSQTQGQAEGILGTRAGVVLSCCWRQEEHALRERRLQWNPVNLKPWALPQDPRAYGTFGRAHACWQSCSTPLREVVQFFIQT